MGLLVVRSRMHFFQVNASLLYVFRDTVPNIFKIFLPSVDDNIIILRVKAIRRD